MCRKQFTINNSFCYLSLLIFFVLLCIICCVLVCIICWLSNKKSISELVWSKLMGYITISLKERFYFKSSSILFLNYLNLIQTIIFLLLLKHCLTHIVYKHMSFKNSKKNHLQIQFQNKMIIKSIYILYYFLMLILKNN